MPLVTVLERPAVVELDTLYLSRLRLRRGPSIDALAPLLLPAGEARRLGAEHRLLWSAMTDDPERARDFLFRREGERSWLVLSRRPPWPGNGLFEVETKRWAPALERGQRLGFALRANATVDRNGKRHDVVMDRLRKVPAGQRAQVRDSLTEEAARDWLSAQGARRGFQVERLEATYRTEQISRGRGRPIEIGVLDLVGGITVEQPEALLAGIAGGIGRARAFGYGLMLIRRAG